MREHLGSGPFTADLPENGGTIFGKTSNQLRVWWDYHTDDEWCELVFETAPGTGCPPGYMTDNKGWFNHVGDLAYTRI